MADSSNPGFRSDDARQGDIGGSNGNSSRPAGRGSRRGFAAMDPSRQREIASKGGRAARHRAARVRAAVRPSRGGSCERTSGSVLPPSRRSRPAICPQW